MSELGTLLKRARLDKGISLEELQESTKIRKRYLEAIEEGNFKVLPGNFYVRAFIKSYAEAVGLDPDEIVDMYGASIPKLHNDTHMEPVRPKSKPRALMNTDRIARWAASLLVISFLALIAVVIYYFVLSNFEDKGSRVANPPRVTDQTENSTPSPLPSATPSPTPEPTPDVPEPTLTFVTTDGTTHVFNVTNADALVVELLARSDCWVHVKQGSDKGKEIKQGTVRKGTSETWTLEDSMHIRLGYPRGVSISVNGIPIESDKLTSDNAVNIQLNLVKE